MVRILSTLLVSFALSARAVDVINALPKLQVVQGDVASFSAQYGGNGQAEFEAFDSGGNKIGQVTKDSSGGLTWTYNSSNGPVGQQQVNLVAIDNGSISDRKSLILQVDPASSRQKWLQQYFGNSSEVVDSADMADPDGDGRSNLHEFAFGLNPKSAADTNGYMGVQNVNGAGVRAVFNRLKDFTSSGLVYQTEFSSNLNDWHTSSDTPVVISDDGTLQKVSLTFPVLPDGNQSRFFRVKVSRSPTP